MLAPGREVGNYRIEQLIGRGGQGFVYRAVHVRLGTVHALKLLQLEMGPLRERLLGEGRIQAHLRHPNLVPVTDIIEVDGALTLVADFVAGVPLDTWAAASRPSLEERLAVFRGVCAAVGAAHAARVVHRDLKPGNVLVELLGGSAVPRVTDFGVAKLLDPDEAHPSTLPGLPVGTPGYMAPEQLRDASSVDGRADLFALGCILYELVCGARPFADKDLRTYAAALTTGSFVPPAERDSTLPPGVVRAIEACLQLDPDARPADIDALLALLDGGQPVPAATRTPTRAVVDIPRHPTAVPLAPPAQVTFPPATAATFPPPLPPEGAVGDPGSRWRVLAGAVAGAAAVVLAVLVANAWDTPAPSAPVDAAPTEAAPAEAAAPPAPTEAAPAEAAAPPAP
ncbi:MAG: protein kinase, partial [Pseudomonadota bacterium]|nr:protein kinase [Pseudomonadota bacterium]